MGELRHNMITRQWVIISTERAKRPSDLSGGNGEKKSLPAYVENCPFCPGNEENTPPELLRLNGEGQWRIRVVPNKFAALASEGDRTRKRDGLKRLVTGVGRHEVIIETPAHDSNPALMELAHVEDIVRVYRDRFIDAHNDERVEHVIIFRNHGEGAGTSLEHPHSQLIAVPVVPGEFRDRVQAAMHYFDDTGECLQCDILNTELKDKTRIVIDTEHFLTFVPFASLTPFYTWIFPKRHSAAFSDINDWEIKDLARHLKTLLAKLYHGLGDPDYNYVIRTSRPKDARNEYCHWYITVIPRLTKTAGFELGSGMYINSSVPENDAEFLRSIEV